MRDVSLRELRLQKRSRSGSSCPSVHCVRSTGLCETAGVDELCSGIWRDLPDASMTYFGIAHG
jgi:hypothetical protein